MTRKLKVLHVITGLDSGGAERALSSILSGGLSRRTDCYVVSLSGEGVYGKQFRDEGIPVLALGFALRPAVIIAIARLMRVFWKFRPDVVQGWMYHGNLIATVLSLLAFARMPVVWNVRQCLYNVNSEKKGTRLVIKFCQILSIIPRHIIYNSILSRTQHEAYGFKGNRGVIIPNGFDLQRWRPDDIRRKKCRKELGVGDDELVIGHIARFHPVKDHQTFLTAIRGIIQQFQSVRVVLAGTDVSRFNPELEELFAGLPGERVIPLGERNDIEDLMCAFDVFCLSSRSEAFPNVLGEAMACGVPCVATDVGDSRRVIGTTGVIVPPNNSESLFQGLKEMVDTGVENRRRLGRAARERIHRNFALDAVVNRYQDLYSSMTDKVKV